MTVYRKYELKIGLYFHSGKMGHTPQTRNIDSKMKIIEGTL